jgi:hypothetical protein
MVYGKKETFSISSCLSLGLAEYTGLYLYNASSEEILCAQRTANENNQVQSNMQSMLGFVFLVKVKIKICSQTGYSRGT